MRLGIRGCRELGVRTWVLKGVDPGVDEAMRGQGEATT